MLSSHGSHYPGAPNATPDEYRRLKNARKLFDVAHVAEAISLIDGLVTTAYTHTMGSYGFKHRLEERMQGGYISNGDTIAAMLLYGHGAQFDEHSINSELVVFG